MKKIRVLTSLALTLILTLSLFTTAAYAANDTYFMQNRNITGWVPQSNTAHTDTGAYTMVGTHAVVEGVLYTVNTPTTIKVVLQKMVGGIVIGESTLSYNVTYSGGTTTNLRTGQPVQGKYFKLSFDVSDGAQYRIRFCNPSRTGELVSITQIYFYSWA